MSFCLGIMNSDISIRNWTCRQNSDAMSRWPAPSVRKNDLRLKLSFLPSTTEGRANLAQCSGTTPCTTCMTEICKCSYDPARDRRRKTYTAELLNFRVALCRMAATLRSGTPEEISSFIQEIRNLPTDQEAIDYLVQGHGISSNM